jgi:hypothetical protein
LDTIDLSELRQCLIVRLPPTPSVSPESFNRDVQSNLVAVLKAVDDGLLGRVDPHEYFVNRHNINASAERWFGIPEDAQGDAIDFRDLSMAGKRNVDRMRNLRCQVMVSKG